MPAPELTAKEAGDIMIDSGYPFDGAERTARRLARIATKYATVHSTSKADATNLQRELLGMLRSVSARLLDEMPEEALCRFFLYGKC